jgi:hypothetical protein
MSLRIWQPLLSNMSLNLPAESTIAFVEHEDAKNKTQEYNPDYVTHSLIEDLEIIKSINAS